MYYIVPATRLPGQLDHVQKKKKKMDYQDWTFDKAENRF